MEYSSMCKDDCACCARWLNTKATYSGFSGCPVDAETYDAMMSNTCAAILNFQTHTDTELFLKECAEHNIEVRVSPKEEDHYILPKTRMLVYIETTGEENKKVVRLINLDEFSLKEYSE